ncbi:MAG: hypothetical protein M3389_00625 [Actinomycetota bacterium]|nr:hypothetical protein [Actinomycetota bacterium]
MSYAEPDEVERVSLIDLSDELGEVWGPWLRHETQTALGRMVGAMRPLGQTLIGEHEAQEMQRNIEALRVQAELALPDWRWARFGPQRRRFRDQLSRRGARPSGVDPAELLAEPDDDTALDDDLLIEILPDLEADPTHDRGAPVSPPRFTRSRR